MRKTLRRKKEETTGGEYLGNMSGNIVVVHGQYAARGGIYERELFDDAALRTCARRTSQ